MKNMYDRLLYLREYVFQTKLRKQLKQKKEQSQNETFNLNYNGIDGINDSDKWKSRIETVSVFKYGKNY
jgi:hypothetical protein